MYATECFKIDKRTYCSIPCLKHALEGSLKEFVTVTESSDEPNSVVNYKYSKSGDTPLILAARYGHHDILRYILTNGGDIEHHNNDGKRALHEAAHNGNVQCVKRLLEFGAHVDVLKRADWTPLMLACTKDNLEIVDCLLEAGAEPSRTNKDGWNSFHIAVREGHQLILETLLSSNHGLWNTRSKNGRTPLHTAAMHGRTDRQTDTVIFLLERCDYPPNDKDSCGSTPLMDAIKFGHVEIAEILVKNHNADITLEDSQGRQCIHLAAMVGNIASVMYLVTNYQTDINGKTYGNQKSPLHFAAKEGHLEIVRYLISLNADLNAVDKNGRTALHLASAAAHTEVVRVFLQVYYMADTQDYNGVTAQDMALKSEVKELFGTFCHRTRTEIEQTVLT